MRLVIEIGHLPGLLIHPLGKLVDNQLLIVGVVEIDLSDLRSDLHTQGGHGDDDLASGNEGECGDLSLLEELADEAECTESEEDSA